MPQMSPLLWFILFIYFIMLYIFVNVLVYYFFFNFSKNESKFLKFDINKFFKWLW